MEACAASPAAAAMPAERARGEAHVVAEVDAADVDALGQELAADAVADRAEAAHDGVAAQAPRQAAERVREPRRDDRVGQQRDHERERGHADEQDAAVVHLEPGRARPAASSSLPRMAATLRCRASGTGEVLDGCVDRGGRARAARSGRCQQAQAPVGEQHARRRSRPARAASASRRSRRGARLPDHADGAVQAGRQQPVGGVEREQGERCRRRAARAARDPRRGCAARSRRAGPPRRTPARPAARPRAPGSRAAARPARPARG